VHVLLPSLVHPIHWYEVGLPLQFAVNVTLVPATGLASDALTVQLIDSVAFGTQNAVGNDPGP
jgi:hypothetical protein